MADIDAARTPNGAPRRPSPSRRTPRGSGSRSLPPKRPAPTADAATEDDELGFGAFEDAVYGTPPDAGGFAAFEAAAAADDEARLRRIRCRPGGRRGAAEGSEDEGFAAFDAARRPRRRTSRWTTTMASMLRHEGAADDDDGWGAFEDAPTAPPAPTKQTLFAAAFGVAAAPAAKTTTPLEDRLAALDAALSNGAAAPAATPINLAMLDAPLEKAIAAARAAQAEEHDDGYGATAAVAEEEAPPAEEEPAPPPSTAGPRAFGLGDVGHLRGAADAEPELGGPGRAGPGRYAAAASARNLAGGHPRRPVVGEPGAACGARRAVSFPPPVSFDRRGRMSAGAGRAYGHAERRVARWLGDLALSKANNNQGGSSAPHRKQNRASRRCAFSEQHLAATR